MIEVVVTWGGEELARHRMSSIAAAEGYVEFASCARDYHPAMQFAIVVAL